MPPQITNDGSFDIAIGKNRKETNWKNKEWHWSTLVEKLSVTHRTAETHAEYITAKKTRQDEIKDVGGFVGGYLNSGRRKAGNVTHRQLITLDLDFATAGLWDDFTLVYENAAALYSTHKHSPNAPRLRLIIPLGRPVFADEYQAIARKIAGNIGIELFDTTTFQPERLMYWPSTSKDGEYIFEFQDGPWLDPDKVLSSYLDWRDSSSWPVSSKVDKLVQRSMVKQGDPLEKPGVIGAWCRTYGIVEVIDLFLSDVYTPCEVENRYTYKEGSTAAGLVVYDDKYAFSHHGTDPTSGKLCNAFDLVRLHKFGLRDEDVREDTPGNKLPSYINMLDFARKDSKVNILIGAEMLADATETFKGIDDEAFDPDAVDKEDMSWMDALERDRKGNCYSTIDNIQLILANDPRLKGRIAYDDFEKCEVAIKNLHWRKVEQHTRRLIDKDDANLRHYLERTYGISSALKVKDAMDVLATKNSFHPIKDYLNACEWDGVPRLDTLFIDYQGAVDNEYTRAVARKTLVAAITRIFRPGAKFDYMPTLVGDQGLKKSTLISKLGKQWFTDSFSTVKGKEAFEQLQGVWIVEVAELSALGTAEIEAVKHFVSKRDDRYRVAFGRRTEIFPRQCIFIGSTNKKSFLKDPTGNRRYWPVLVHINQPTKDVMTDLTNDEIDQIWGEAMYRFKKGEKIFLSPELEEMAGIIQKEHTEEHPWTGIIQNFLDIKIPENWYKMTKYERSAFLQGDELQAEGAMYRDRICIHELWIEALQRRDTIDVKSSNIIRNIMLNTEGWREELKPMKFGNYGSHRKGFFRTELPEKLIAETLENSGNKPVTNR